MMDFRSHDGFSLTPLYPPVRSTSMNMEPPGFFGGLITWCGTRWVDP